MTFSHFELLLKVSLFSQVTDVYFILPQANKAHFFQAKMLSKSVIIVGALGNNSLKHLFCFPNTG